MSTFQGGQFPARVRRNTTPQLGQSPQMIAGQTPAAGVGTMRPGGLDAATAQRLQSVQQWLGMTGDITGQLARRHALRTREEETLSRGQAATDARMKLPDLQRQVAAGELDFLFDGDDDVSEDVRLFVEDQVGDVDSEAYREAYTSLLAPQLASVVVARQRSMIQREQDETGTLAIEAATVATDAESVTDAVGTWRMTHPDASESDALSAVVIPAARSAATLGDAGREQLETLLGVLGDRFPAEQREIRDIFDATTRQQRLRFEQDLQHRVHDLTRNEPPVDVLAEQLERVDGLDEGRQQDVLQGYTRERIKTSAQLGRAQQILDLSRHLPQTEANQAYVMQHLESSRRAMIADHFEAQAGEISNRNLDMMRRGDETAGSVHVQDITLIGPDGSEHTISRADQLEDARLREWQRIDEQFPRDQAPEANLDARLEFMRRNPDITDPEIEATFAGVHGRIPVDAEESDVPEASTRSLGLYRHIQQTHPDQLDAHIDGRDRAFLRVADAIGTYSPVTDQQALLLAAQAERTGGLEAVRGATGAELNKAVARHTGRLFRDDVINDADVRAELEERARIYVATQRVSVPAAIKKAEADFLEDSTIIGNRWVNVAGRKHTIGAIDDIDAVGRTIVDHYIANLDADAPAAMRRADAYTLVPDTSGNTWFVSWQGNGLPAEGASRYSDGDLKLIDETMHGMQAEEARRQGLQRAQERMQQQQTMVRSNLNQIAREIESHTIDHGGFNFDSERFNVDPEPVPDVTGGFPTPPSHLDSIFNFIRTTPQRDRAAAERDRIDRIMRERRRGQRLLDHGHIGGP